MDGRMDGWMDGRIEGIPIFCNIPDFICSKSQVKQREFLMPQIL